MKRHLSGARCPECATSLPWPHRAPDHHMLRCANGHPICTMKEFRQAAYEMALIEEMQLYREGLPERGESALNRSYYKRAS